MGVQYKRLIRSLTLSRHTRPWRCVSLVGWPGPKSVRLLIIWFPSFRSRITLVADFSLVASPTVLLVILKTTLRRDVKALSTNAHLFRIKSWLRQMTVKRDTTHSPSWTERMGVLAPYLHRHAEKHGKTTTPHPRERMWVALWKQRKQITWNIYYISWISVIYGITTEQRFAKTFVLHFMPSSSVIME